MLVADTVPLEKSLLFLKEKITKYVILTIPILCNSVTKAVMEQHAPSMLHITNTSVTRTTRVYFTHTHIQKTHTYTAHREFHQSFCQILKTFSKKQVKKI